ncbi:hypothetical protein CC78DRAFT_563647 [Lojkania enalia]|uniref:Uncharacterized protein n=1 Tax=Lojkania enalia TaxID=147567 RepID=A0A9P4TR27_9PLEO|nr:hypothetical protein CC78DRAFT_563647 [Didymosphaeria enalia]
MPWRGPEFAESHGDILESESRTDGNGGAWSGGAVDGVYLSDNWCGRRSRLLGARRSPRRSTSWQGIAQRWDHDGQRMAFQIAMFGNGWAAADWPGRVVGGRVHGSPSASSLSPSPDREWECDRTCNYPASLVCSSALFCPFPRRTQHRGRLGHCTYNPGAILVDSQSLSLESPTCYFSIAPVPSAAHFSVETPSTTPLSHYCAETFAEPTNPLLALRPLPVQYHPSSAVMEASKLLQLQTAAAHARPSARPVQSSVSTSTSSTSSASSSQCSSPPPLMLCCARCRRSAVGPSGMVKFGTNLYYCTHCADMVGYNAG